MPRKLPAKEPPLRARDPGVKLFQIADLQWVHCPRCDGPARFTDQQKLSCLKCSYTEGGPKPNRRRLCEVVLAKPSPKCPNPKCGTPVPNVGRVVRGGGSDEDLAAEVRCPTCGEVGRHPALPVTPRDFLRGRRQFWGRFYGRWPAPYLTRRIGAHTLVVHNLQHLAMLEEWLGASLRERGPVEGLTMMSRLPRWMKAAESRPKVLKALAELKEQALREGLS